VKLPGFLRGLPQVARAEFLGNVKSVRFLIMALGSALVIVGGAYGFAGLTGGGGSTVPPLAVWGHASYTANGSHLATVWVSDPLGDPFGGQTVTFREPIDQQEIASVATDGNGFARLEVGNRSDVEATVRIGTAQSTRGITWSVPSPGNFTVVFAPPLDLDNNQIMDDLTFQVLTRTGDPATATLKLNGADAGSLGLPYGFKMLHLPVGESNLTIEVAGEAPFTIPEYVFPGGGFFFSSGPDLVLFIIASLSLLVVSIFAIVVSFDAVSKERVQGTMDLLLSRPVSRTGVLLGKFLGAFAAVALPVTLVNLAGIGAISAASGKSPTGSFAAAFVGYSLLLIAFYVLLQLTLSTLAKTSGNAVLFGVLLWLLLNIFYNLIVFLLQTFAFGGDFAAGYKFSQYASLGNPSAVVGVLISLAAPSNLFDGGLGGSVVEASAAGAAAVVWFVLLLALALWTFHRKAAE